MNDLVIPILSLLCCLLLAVILSIVWVILLDNVVKK